MRDTVVDIARAAGNVLLAHYGKLRRDDADLKDGNRRDLVSQADLDAEEYIKAHIPEDDDLLSEESPAREQGASRQWIVDPLDGTVNFLHGIPFWGVSIAVLENGEFLAGAIHAPALNQTFSAERGEGAHLNGERIDVSKTAALGDSVVATGFAYARNELPDHNIDNFVEVCRAAAGVRRMGAAALDLAYTACGRLDGFWELHLNPWDVAAGIL
ncbi:MAG: inositol monophosphatase family protein, partial [Planctomycetota bacterium]